MHPPRTWPSSDRTCVMHFMAQKISLGWTEVEGKEPGKGGKQNKTPSPFSPASFSPMQPFQGAASLAKAGVLKLVLHPPAKLLPLLEAPQEK